MRVDSAPEAEEARGWFWGWWYEEEEEDGTALMMGLEEMRLVVAEEGPRGLSALLRSSWEGCLRACLGGMMPVVERMLSWEADRRRPGVGR